MSKTKNQVQPPQTQHIAEPEKITLEPLVSEELKQDMETLASDEPDISTEEYILRRIHNLEQLVIRMAHNSGTSHVTIKNAGLEPYNPNAKDMSRFRIAGNRG